MSMLGLQKERIVEILQIATLLRVKMMSKDNSLRNLDWTVTDHIRKRMSSEKILKRTWIAN